jgi:hypothetical protein
MSTASAPQLVAEILQQDLASIGVTVPLLKWTRCLSSRLEKSQIGGCLGRNDWSYACQPGNAVHQRISRACAKMRRASSLLATRRVTAAVSRQKPRRVGRNRGWQTRRRLSSSLNPGRSHAARASAALRAGKRGAGPEQRPVGRPGDRPWGCGALAGVPSIPTRSPKPRSTRQGVR